MIELDPKQQYQLEQAWEELNFAQKLCDAGRRARGQEVLRKAQALFFQLPRGFTLPEFEQQYEQLYSKLYRGF